MYVIPQLYRCPKCKYEFKWSETADFLGLPIPFCPKCYVEFLIKNVPVGIKEAQE